ncbi:uncharacterized protein PGTG_08152 [Puccinia graminis f. sp. tritici CRL 75-36-700-3]|uniref:DUF6818 domain-containing protein n=1 Tax=Puccinia graminis f. sp. tritici (strain CRL 75-36-700-3 / race SCCL) TaxID=418459 RepID=E3KCF5_PUCGT|nr:uncharacterized protein PGTG_08152 [Puccinia graminis f. sp. tritici CRL 75-36-700-3]EFP81903.1 hypothetical protein PGTG_08152 [Puccinia graminis f. sp. tritici CRL 75-36-700-3]
MDPTQLTHPIQPTHPIQLTQPTQQTHHTQILHPIQLTQPTQLTHPMQLTQASELSQQSLPSQLISPTLPTQPTQKSNPIQSNQPTHSGTATSIQSNPSARLAAATASKRPGRQKGSLGYTTPDCLALVDAVKMCLPLGSQEWGYVQVEFNKYAQESGRPTREAEALKLKFRALANQTKPTGDADCPSYVREAKAAQISIDRRAHVISFNDNENTNETHEIRGEVEVSLQDHEEADLDFGNNEVLPDPLDLTTPPATNPSERSQLQSDNSGPNSRCFSAWSQRTSGSASGSHQNPLVNRPDTWVRSDGPYKSAAQSRRPGLPPPQLEENMVAYFDPQAREARDHERSVTQFYAFSLQDSRAANACLEAKIKELRDGDKSLANQLKIKNDRLKEKINEQKFEIQGLKNEIKFLQLQLDFGGSTQSRLSHPSNPSSDGHLASTSSPHNA